MKRVVFFAVSLWVLSIAAYAFAGPAPNTLTERLVQSAGGKAHLSYHSGTGMVRFLRVQAGDSIPQPTVLPAGATAEAAARNFLSTYGPLFGISDQARELTVKRQMTAANGRSFVRFQQVYNSIPVMAGELIVQANGAKNVVSVNGEISPKPAVDTTPSILGEKAKDTALGLIMKHYKRATGSLRVSSPELWIYNPVLLGPGVNSNRLVWRMEVTADDLSPIRELVLVDAHKGGVLLHFNQEDSALYRKIYDNGNDSSLPLPGNEPPARIEGGPVSAVADVNNAYDYSGDTYNFYSTYHGRDSIDNAGMVLVNTVRYCPDDTCPATPFQNAFWNGEQMVYGAGFASADDVVGHELTHGVTERESGLYYYMQSGAINESFSDVWGEFVDQTNGRGTDTPEVKWLMGEDLSIGAVRSMKDPTLYGNPDRMTSPNYWCYPDDQGGVHANSGVNNKAAYLMTEGAQFNGITVTGLGIAKVAKIYYEVQTNLFTSGSDYADLYDALQTACNDLIGTSGITSADCQQVKNAVDAVEMDQQPTSCAATEAPVCVSGTPDNIFFDNLESGGANWYYGELVNDHYAGSPLWGIDYWYATSGTNSLFGWNADAIADTYVHFAQGVTLPANAYMHFNHAYNLEYDGVEGFYDGAVVEYSTDGGTTWHDAGSLITDNGYNGQIYSGYGNPLSGRNAFVGESGGYISSRLDLSSLAGQTVDFRFRVASDSSYGYEGWYIDDIRIYTCSAAVADKIGVYDHGIWYLDTNTSWAWDGTPTDTLGVFGVGLNGAVPVVGDWNADKTTKIGVFMDGIWYLDMNRNWQWDGESADRMGVFGVGLTGAVPVVGDWNGDGTTEIGIYQNGYWYLDMNNNGQWDGEPTDRMGVFGVGLTGAVPVVGDWNGDGTTEIGIYQDGYWYLDVNRNWQWDGTPTDTLGVFGVGLTNAVPVTGDWNADGRTEIGIYQDGYWYLDKNQNWQWDGEPTDKFGVFGVGLSGVVPVVGKW